LILPQLARWYLGKTVTPFNALRAESKPAFEIKNTVVAINCRCRYRSGGSGHQCPPHNHQNHITAETNSLRNNSPVRMGAQRAQRLRM
jgi:hypothetical protein